MYQQIKPTETFCERELALLMEAKKRRLVGWRVDARRTPTKARSTIALAVVGLLGALVVASLMLAASSSPAHAQTTTFLVNSTADQPDANTTDGKCFALNASCPLRAAIQQAHATPGADVIEFAISGGEVHTITPSPQLPTITEAVTINGYSQAGASANTLAKGTNAKIMIELRNEDPLGGGFGLVVNAPNVVIKGLNINNFPASGIIVGSEDSRSAEGVKIQGNFIGTDPTGITGLGNDGFGVLVGARSGVTIGGTSSAKRNLISGNNLGGVRISDSSNIKVLGNLIGTKSDGKGALGNGGDGVEIVGTTNTLVGSATSASVNTIAFNNLGDGVEVSVGTSTNNRVLRNSIFRNDGLGIDLLGSGEDQTTNVSTPNDALDADSGPNGLQNKPTIASAKTILGKTTIKGKLSSKKNQTYVVRFFSNSSGNESKTFIGQKKVTTGKDGKVSFTFSPAQKVGVGKLVTATATGSEGTSEFSAPRKVASS